MRTVGWKNEGLVVAAIVLLAMALRIWRLDYRPLSTDEILTVLVSIGRSYRDVPIGQMWPLTDLARLLSPVYGLNLRDISRTLADPEMHHAHPPLFYWVLYGWINWLRPLGADLVLAVRILPAIFGTAIVGLTYGLARTSVSRQAAGVSALLMAVSPLGVYLSQDARNYTLPLMFVIAALWALAAIVNRSAIGRNPSWALWIIWTGANTLSCYSHYFSILSVAAQVAALLMLIGAGVLTRASVNRSVLARAGVGLAAAVALCAPLGRTLLQDYNRVSLNRSDNEWMQPRSLVDPIREALAGWAAMVSPVFNEIMPLWMLIAVTVALAIVVWAAIVSVTGVIRQLRDRSPAVVMLAAFSVSLFLELLVIVYVLDKDVFRYPRYHFLYFPAVLVLLASGLTAAVGAMGRGPGWRPRLGIAGLVIAGLGGSVINAYGYGLQDSYYARQTARQVTSTGDPALVVMGGDSFLTTAMGLSIAREIVVGVPRSATGAHWFGYVPWASKADQNWPGALTVAGPLPQHVWLIHRPPDTSFPATIEVHSSGRGNRLACTSGPEGLHWSGLEYQRYQCVVR